MALQAAGEPLNVWYWHKADIKLSTQNVRFADIHGKGPRCFRSKRQQTSYALAFPTND